jgi:phytoene dehydrogenase-like protein
MMTDSKNKKFNRTSTKHKKDARICIVGGGPAGLSSALYLNRKGFKNITILEKNEAVGGKALTVELKDSNGIVKNYELGAEYITYTYDHIFDLCKLLNEKTSLAASIQIINKTGKNPRFLDPAKVEPFYKIVFAAIKYLWFGFRYRKAINSPNNLGLTKHKLLTMSLKDFEEEYNLTSLRAFFLNVGFGYNLDPEFPVIFVYRMLKPKLMLRIMGSYIPIIKHLFKRPIASIAENGTQGLFKKLAAYLERAQGKQMVFTNHKVTKIERDNTKELGGIKVTINDLEEKEFDILIFSLTPSFMLKMMEGNQLSPKETNLFNKFKFHTYYVSMLGTLNKGDNPLPAYYYNNIFPDIKDGKPEPEPVQFSKRWDDTNLIARGYNWKLADIFNTNDPEKKKEAEVVFKQFMKDRMETPDFEYLNPSESYPTVDKYWGTYFPHVSIDEVQKGFYDEFETLQGENNTYFAGSSMTFEMMESTVAYSQYLINKYF